MVTLSMSAAVSETLALEAVREARWRIVLFHGSAPRARALLGELSGIDLILAGHDQTQASTLTSLDAGALVETLRDARAISRVELGSEPRLRVLPLDGHVPDDRWARARVERY